MKSRLRKLLSRKPRKVFVLYYDDEDGGTYTVGILTTFEKAEDIVNDNFKVLGTYCDSNMVTYETDEGIILVIQEWNMNDVDNKALDWFKK